VAIDLDFVYAIKRVEDFGCRTAVLAVGLPAPAELQKNCDYYHLYTKDHLKGDGSGMVHDRTA
jgi:uncharacterized LabA/DUF88 family protein